MTPKRALELLARQRASISDLVNTPRNSPLFAKWRRDTEVAIERIFGAQSRNASDFASVRYSLAVFGTWTQPNEHQQAYVEGLAQADAILASMEDEISDYEIDDDTPSSDPSAFTLIERLCLRFHAAARQLQQRHANRATLTVEDEYDVQDLMHALLRVHFEDVREEEWAPSYAGASSRMDFMLKEERVVIEIKKTRKGMTPRTLGEELIIDIAKYEQHPDCDTLVCFVYDPEGRIGNPVGIERDLEGHTGRLRVRVIIAPKN